MATVFVAASVSTGGTIASNLAEEIVVVGTKFRAMKFKADVSNKNGAIIVKGCRITKSSKDKSIDALGCAVTRECAATSPATPEEFRKCIETRGPEAVSALARQRVAAKDAL
jgi:hypothetical protein